MNGRAQQQSIATSDDRDDIIDHPRHGQWRRSSARSRDMRHRILMKKVLKYPFKHQNLFLYDSLVII